MKKTTSFLLSIALLFGMITGAFAADTNQIADVIADTAAYVYHSVPAPKVGSVGGEWAVLALARSGVEIPEGYFQAYYTQAKSAAVATGGVLHEKKYTEYARVILALTAIGKNPADVAGYNLLTPLGDYEKTIWQGVNGPVWALIALDSGGYEIPQNPNAQTQATRELYIDRILACELDGGGWALSASAETADPDVTAMALVALASYQDRAAVAAAGQRGLARLSAMQSETGGFAVDGTESAESTAQVLTAISALGISYRDERFVKNGNTLLDHLLRFYTKGQGFAHVQGAGQTNLMATEQCLYALVAAFRCEAGQSPLFSMNDSMNISEKPAGYGLPGKHPAVAASPVQFPQKTFADIQGHPAQAAMEGLAASGIINGMDDAVFAPDNTMTRAEFATIVVKALGLPLTEEAPFADVTRNDWFFAYVSTAHRYGIINGVSDTVFLPNGTITREEAAVMTARAASLCGMAVELEPFAVKNILAEFVDYVKTADWAASAVAFCYAEALLDRSDIDIRPKEAATRAEIAQMVYHMLRKADLLCTE